MAGESDPEQVQRSIWQLFTNSCCIFMWESRTRELLPDMSEGHMGQTLFMKVLSVRESTSECI